MRKLPRHIETIDDERRAGNGVIVTLAYGFSYYQHCHEGVRGFDTMTEARQESTLRSVHPCACSECAEAIARRAK